MSVHLDLSYDASCTQRRGHGDKPNLTFYACHHEAYSANPRQSEFFPNCVGEFGMDTG